LHFDGKQARVRLDAGVVPPPWSVCMWVRREDATNTAASLMDSKEYTGTSLRLEQAATPKKLGITKYTVVDAAFDYSAPVGVWVFLTFIATDKSVTLYADGALVGVVNQTMPLSADTLGSHAHFSMKGDLDEVRVYSRALSAEEIGKLHRLGR
jgi:hypothetical protein